VLNYNCPNKRVFYRSYGFICDFLEFPSLKSSTIFTVHPEPGGIRILNTKKVGFVQALFFYFCKVKPFAAGEKKTGRIYFPQRRAPTKGECLLTVCQILRNFTKENARKLIVSFACLAQVNVIKYRKTLTFSFECAQITKGFVLSARAIVKL